MTSQKSDIHQELSPRHNYAWKHLFKLRSAFNGYNQILTNPDQRHISSRIHIPEDRIIRYPLSHWIKKLQNKLAGLSHASIYDNAENILDDFAVVINQSSFVVALLGNADCAKAICNKAIEYYYTVYTINNNHEFLCQAIQPWINIARLERISKNIDLSNHMFHFLSGHFPSSTNIEKIIKMSLEQAKITKNLHSKVANHCFTVEPIANAIAHKDFKGLKNLLLNHPSREFIRNPTLREAQIISHFYNETPVHYNIVVFTGFNLCRIQDLDVFSLRLAEYFYLINDYASLEIITNQLFLYCLDLLESSVNIVEHAQLILCILQSMLSFECKDQAYELSVKLLDQYLILDDEPGIIAALQVICNLPQGAKNARYKKMLATHLATTDYFFLKDEKVIGNEIQRQSEALMFNIFKILNP